MKKYVKKMVLTRETLRTLQSNDLNRAAGGTLPTDWWQIQATDCACTMHTVCDTFCPG